jgi:hypothetical protein
MAIGDTGFITGRVVRATDLCGAEHAVRLGISTDPGRAYHGPACRIEALRRLRPGDTVTVKYEVVEFGERNILACTLHSQA